MTRFYQLVFSFLSIGLGCPAFAADETGLIGHWPLAGDANDKVSQHAGKSVDVDYGVAGPGGKPNTAARFDGIHSCVEIDPSQLDQLGRGDFTLSVWVRTEDRLDDAIGDVLSKFDPQTRRGINWCIRNSPGVSGNQANNRNIHFGIDAGTEPKWTDCGRPGTNVFPMALATYDGKLYAGVCEPGKNDAGHVYQYAGGQVWIDCGSLDASNAVTNLAVHQGKLYAGTGNYRLRGSLLPESENTQPGGKVFCYEGNGKWTDCGRVGNMAALGGMVTYKGELYATSMFKPGEMYRYLGNQKWEACPLPSPGRRVASPTVFNGNLYCVTFDGSCICCFDGRTWSPTVVLDPVGRGQTYSLDIFQGELYASTWPDGKVYRSADGEKWIDTGRTGQELEVMGMAVYNGKLYGGTLPLAEVYRYDGDNQWTNTGRLDITPDVTYRRAWTMAVYNGKLFCGTLPSGHIHSLETGVNATYDYQLESGWHHLAAVRSGNRLKLYVDGELAGESPSSQPSLLDVSNRQPLKIGFGSHDYFNGCLSDLRIYSRALTPNEITKAAQAHASANLRQLGKGQ